jgi:membrane-associated phospholipid phosphatase
MNLIKDIFYKFGENIARIFGWKRLFWHLLAILLTYISVVSGFDWWYYVSFHGAPYQFFLFPAVIIGGFLPILLPIVLYIIGKHEKKLILLNTAYAVAQSAILGSFVSSLYKAFTGRIQPPFHVVSLVDISRSFQFGFWEYGIFWGWPSSHTTIAFAVGVTLYVLYPKNWKVRFIAIFTAFYIGIGVSTSIHWFSDFVAGAILGTLIGYVVGKAFYKRLPDRL